MNRLGQCLRADGYAMTRRRTIWLLPLCLMALIIIDSVDVVPVMLHGYTIFMTALFYVLTLLVMQILVCLPYFRFETDWGSMLRAIAINTVPENIMPRFYPNN